MVLMVQLVQMVQKVIKVHVSPEVHKQIKVKASEAGRSMKDYILDCVEAQVTFHELKIETEKNFKPKQNKKCDGMKVLANDTSDPDVRKLLKPKKKPKKYKVFGYPKSKSLK